MKFPYLTLVSFLFLIPVEVIAKSEFMKEFKKKYSSLNLPLENSYGEVAEISNFTYKKDVATFTFVKGEIHLLRFVDERPTAALFIGNGRADITVPDGIEKVSLLAVTRDSLVSENFQVCFIRFADNLDLLLREKFSFKKERLDWKAFNASRKAQSEIFFRPVIFHQIDNQLQLLHSLYERDASGYFWADFNRYNFNYDPNRPEQVRVAYEFEGGDVVPTEASVFQEEEAAKTTNSQMSDIAYPTTILKNRSEITIGGLDGRTIDNCQSNIQLLLNSDSTKFISLFLHYNLRLDSVYLNGNEVDYFRRKDFKQIVVIPQNYFYQGDTINVTLWYKGKNFDNPIPYVENPSPSENSITFLLPKGYNLVAPGLGKLKEYNKKLNTVESTPQKLSRKYYYQAYASGFDTIQIVSSTGISLNFLKSKAITKKDDCYIPDKIYQSAILMGFEYFINNFGGPQGTFVEYVYPEGYRLSMPGMIKVPQVVCIRNDYFKALGGFNILAGKSLSLQWFGELLHMRSSRESWISSAVQEYMMLMQLEGELKGGQFFSNLLIKKDSLFQVLSLNREVPLATSTRLDQKLPVATIQNCKGAWIFHMLRMLMLDTNDLTDKKFRKFMQEIIFRFNSKSFDNNYLIEIAEKHYGESLDWFFNQWLYGTGIPNFDAKYKISKVGGEYFIDLDVTVSGVSKDFMAPTIISIEENDNNSFVRENISAGKNSFRYGPYDEEPKELQLNEFLSVLSKDKLEKL